MLALYFFGLPLVAMWVGIIVANAPFPWLVRLLGKLLVPVAAVQLVLILVWFEKDCYDVGGLCSSYDDWVDAWGLVYIALFALVVGSAIVVKVSGWRRRRHPTHP